MRSSFRLQTSMIVAAALMGGPILPAQAVAQPAPPSTASAVQIGDPSARVGRLAGLAGTVSFHPPGGDHWDPATLNYPVTSGNAFWTQPQSRAVVEVSGTRVVLAPSTELDVDTLDDRTLATTEPQGEVCVLVQALGEGESTVLRTPRGVVTITAPGRYGVSAGDTDHPTSVTVLAGAAVVNGAGADLQLAAGQTGIVNGTDAFQAQVVAEQHDPFLASACEPHAPQRPGAVALPPSVALMAGTDDLAQYGTWQPSSEYGLAWYPQVASGWVPYREGRWAYVAPWGWTWIDNAPWGFAPFHYGRWAYIGRRWGWVPASYAVEDAAPPVYAPALVSFVDPGAGFAAGLAVGAVAGSALVGWLPLGPREPYRPWYHASDGYIRNVNIRQVRSVTNINTVNNVTIDRYANGAAATAVPVSAMTASTPVARAARPIPQVALARARPVVGPVPVQPTIATAGVTRALATRMHLQAPVGAPSAGRPPAPGPVLAERTNPGAPIPLRAAPASAVREALPPIAFPGARGRPPGQGGAPGPPIVPRAPTADRATLAAPVREAPPTAPRVVETPAPRTPEPRMTQPRPPAPPRVAIAPPRMEPPAVPRVAPPEFHAPPPVAHVAPPVVRAPAPATPQVYRAPPSPVARTAPPPAMRPPPQVVRAAPPSLHPAPAARAEAGGRRDEKHP